MTDSLPTRFSFFTSTTAGMISPAFSITTWSPTRMSLRSISSKLCKVALLTVLPLRKTGSKRATGVSAPVRPTWISTANNLVSACSGWYLYAIAQRGALLVAPSSRWSSWALTLMTAPSVS
jgi:hypothetical protein